MGFGISDEVLEKILAEPWTTPSDLGFVYTNPRTQHKHTPYIRPVAPKIETTTVVKTVDKTSSKRENENYIFLQAVIGQIASAFTGGIYNAFKSQEYKQMFDSVKEHFDSTARALNLGVQSTASYTDKVEKARRYLFDGVSEQIFYHITHGHFDKPSFRNIVDDTIYLMQQWQILPNAETRSKKKEVFFGYYINRFGLSESQFHCCPNCGAVLINGVANCPNCFLNVGDFRNKEQTAETRVIPAAKEIDVHEILRQRDALDKELQDIRAEFEIMAARLADVENGTDETLRLRAEVERLSNVVREKDTAITAMSDFIRGTQQSESTATEKRILIIGDSLLDEQEMIAVSVEVGFEAGMLEFQTDYGKIKRFAARIRNDAKYAGIIVGAVPHKVQNLGNATSLSTLFKGEGYPFTVEARTYQGDLKITLESLRKALSNLMFHLISKGLM